MISMGQELFKMDKTHYDGEMPLVARVKCGNWLFCGEVFYSVVYYQGEKAFAICPFCKKTTWLHDLYRNPDDVDKEIIRDNPPYERLVECECGALCNLNDGINCANCGRSIELIYYKSINPDTIAYNTKSLRR